MDELEWSEFTVENCLDAAGFAQSFVAYKSSPKANYYQMNTFAFSDREEVSYGLIKVDHGQWQGTAWKQIVIQALKKANSVPNVKVINAEMLERFKTTLYIRCITSKERTELKEAIKSQKLVLDYVSHEDLLSARTFSYYY